jgi:ribosome recycling factor
VPVPALTHERRLEMVKLLGQKIEAGKVMVRNVRSETKHQIESQKGEEGVSEDDIERDLSSLEDKVQQHLDKIETLFTDKEKELLTI